MKVTQSISGFSTERKSTDILHELKVRCTLCTHCKARESLLRHTSSRHWRSAGMETSTGLDRPTGCGSCWCPAVRQSLLSHRCPVRRRRAIPLRPTSQSGPGGSGGPGCCNRLCSLSRRVASRRSCRRSRHASARSSRPDASMSSPRPPRCCRRSSACGWPSPGSRRGALWGSGLKRDGRIATTLVTSRWHKDCVVGSAVM